MYQTTSAQFNPHLDIVALAEEMIQFERNLRLWRDAHVGMVAQMIGTQPGTGASSGVSLPAPDYELRAALSRTLVGAEFVEAGKLAKTTLRRVGLSRPKNIVILNEGFATQGVPGRSVARFGFR